jgi:hypothetical protein
VGLKIVVFWCLQMQERRSCISKIRNSQSEISRGRGAKNRWFLLPANAGIAERHQQKPQNSKSEILTVPGQINARLTEFIAPLQRLSIRDSIRKMATLTRSSDLPAYSIAGE